MTHWARVAVAGIVVANEAVRDAGTSLHYLPASETVKANHALAESLIEAMSRVGLPVRQGFVWTTDVPYGETNSQSFDAEIDAEESATADSPNLASELAGRTLSLGECVTVALEHNPRTAESWQSIRAAAARTGRAKADYLPIIGFTSSAARGETVELNRNTDFGTQNRYDGVFGLRWLIFDGGGREARVDAATAEVLAAGFRHNTALQDVALLTVESFYNLLAARSFRQFAEETVRQRDYQLRPGQGGQPQVRRLLQGHEAQADHRGRDHPLAAHPVHGRADHRHRRG